MMDFVTVEKGKIMAEYIDKEALRDALYGADAITMNGVKILNQFPSADVAPVKHGRWIEHKHFHHDHYIDSTYECSECNVEEPLTSDYCPNCGAKMDGDGNG